jgi:hypothetical protein
MENFVDFISSAVVLWRFYAPGELTKEREKLLNDREDRAAVAISFLIILLGCLVIPGKFSTDIINSHQQSTTHCI